MSIIKFLVHWSNSTSLKNMFKMAQKVNVEPDMDTYWFNTVMYKYLITN